MDGHCQEITANRTTDFGIQWALLAIYQVAKMQSKTSLFTSYDSRGHRIPGRFRMKDDKSSSWEKTDADGKLHAPSQLIWRTDRDSLSFILFATGPHFGKGAGVEKSLCLWLLVSLSAWPGMKERRGGTTPAIQAWPGHDGPTARGREQVRRVTKKSRGNLKRARIHTHIVPIRCQ